MGLCGGDSCQLGDGAIGDMASDASGDAQGAQGCVTSSFDTAMALGVTGHAYSRNVASLALLDDPMVDGNILQITSPGSMLFPVVFAQPPAGTVRHPRLAPSTVGGKAQAFFLMGDGPVVLAKALRQTGTTWDEPEVVAIDGLVVDPSTTFGQPTATIPRLMLAARSGMVFEGTEQTNGSWQFAAIGISAVSGIAMPSLSRDGLTAVFRGRDTDNMVKLFVAHRPSTASTFNAVTPLVDNPGGIAGTEQFPSFDNTCKELYVSFDETVFVMK